MLTQKEIYKKVNSPSRKTNLAVKRKEISFENQMKKLDIQIQNITKQQIYDFDNSISKHLDNLTNTQNHSVEKYKKKIIKILRLTFKIIFRHFTVIKKWLYIK